MARDSIRRPVRRPLVDRLRDQRGRRLRRLAVSQLIALDLVLATGGLAAWYLGGSTGVGGGAGPADRAAAAASGVPAARPTLLITVVGRDCRVFVRVPGGPILLNEVLSAGRSVSFDEPTLDVVLGDPRAVAVTVNGVPRPRPERDGPDVFTAGRA